MRRDHGRETFDGLPPAVAYLELYFNIANYLDKPVLLVKEHSLRDELAKSLPPSEAEMLRKTSRLPPRLLMNGSVLDLLDKEHRLDAKGAVHNARLQIESTAGGEFLQSLISRPGLRLPLESLQSRFQTLLAVAPLDVRLTPQNLPDDKAFAWLLAAGFNDARAADVGQAVESLHALQNKTAQEIGLRVPSMTMRKAERLYNQTASSTLLWAGFALATVLLLLTAGSDLTCSGSPVRLRAGPDWRCLRSPRRRFWRALSSAGCSAGGRGTCRRS